VKVAVVIPVRNSETMVGVCVTAGLVQTRPPDEVIVVDKGSTDATAASATAAGATVLSEPIPGSYRARNRGWESTNADVIAFTDGDCLPRPNWLAELLEPFRTPTVVAVGGPIIQAELNSAAQRWIVERHFLDQAFNVTGAFLPFFATANVACRRSVLETLGGFDSAFQSGGDNDFSWRVQALAGGTLVYRPGAEVRHAIGERRLSSRPGRTAIPPATSCSTVGGRAGRDTLPRRPSLPGPSGCGSCPLPSGTAPGPAGPCPCR
jgi:glycosyltransferase involved in cell wall biosynthesis